MAPGSSTTWSAPRSSTPTRACSARGRRQRHGWIAAWSTPGYADRLLISSDVFIKCLLRRYGGPGYGHVLQYFVPRLHRWGLDDAAVNHLLVDNPRALFDLVGEPPHPLRGHEEASGTSSSRPRRRTRQRPTPVQE